MKRLITFGLAMSHCAFAQANAVTASIQTLHVNLQSNIAHVQFVGAPVLDGGGCALNFSGNSLDEEKFMKYIWPLLVTAKASGARVTVVVSGCINGFAKIYSIDYEPRL